MPSLRGLECYVETGSSNQPLPEYRPTYRDGYVETFIAVPNSSTPFSIHLKALEHVASGVAMFVFIDGTAQCSRNCQGLESGTIADFRVRQKEEKIDEGKWIGREWKFEKLKLVEDTDTSNESKDYVDNVGTIEVVVLRCKSGSVGSYSVPEKRNASTKQSTFAVAGKKETTKKTTQNQKCKSKSKSDTGSIMSGLFGLFDGASDHNFGLDGGHDHDDVWSEAASEKSKQTDASDSQTSSTRRRRGHNGLWPAQYMQGHPMFQQPGYPIMQPGYPVPLQQPYVFPSHAHYYPQHQAHHHHNREGGLGLVGEGRYEGGKRHVRRYSQSHRSDSSKKSSKKQSTSEKGNDDGWDTGGQANTGGGDWAQEGQIKSSWAEQDSSPKAGENTSWSKQGDAQNERNDQAWSEKKPSKPTKAPQARTERHKPLQKAPQASRSMTSNEPAVPTDPTKPIIKPYWSTQTTTLPKSKSKRVKDIYITPALPLPSLPAALATAAQLSHQVSAGPGVLYHHRAPKPVYQDSMQRPYAVFCFKYRSLGMLKEILGSDVEVEEDVEAVKKRWVRERDKKELVEELAWFKRRAGYHLESDVDSETTSGTGDGDQGEGKRTGEGAWDGDAKKDQSKENKASAAGWADQGEQKGDWNGGGGQGGDQAW